MASFKTNNKKRLLLLAKKDARVRKLLDNLINELASVSLRIDDIPDDKLFQFSAYPQVAQETAELIGKYTTLLTNEIKTGVNQAFSLSYSASTDFLGKWSILSQHAVDSQRKAAEMAFWKSRMQPEQGLSLSKLVWNYVSQTKAEFEMGLSDILAKGLREGVSAETLGRMIRGRLNNPDAMYRRYHEKVINDAGKKVDKVFWQKRVVDEDGKVHFVKGDIESVGRGVYRSARKNALRVTRNEINNAYRYADYERWNSEPFVIGFEIRLSGSHPAYDMCDELVGRYPKWFKWLSWHISCLCVAVPILIPEEEMREIQNLPEEEYKNYKSRYLITEMPDNYKKYINDNADRLDASIERGKQPWWVRDNYVDGDYRKGFLNGVPAQETKPERPPKTPEQIADIKARWEKRQNATENDRLEQMLIRRMFKNDSALIESVFDSEPTVRSAIDRITSVNANVKKNIDSYHSLVRLAQKDLDKMKLLGARGRILARKEAFNVKREMVKFALNSSISTPVTDRIYAERIRLTELRENIQKQWNEYRHYRVLGIYPGRLEQIIASHPERTREEVIHTLKRLAVRKEELQLYSPEQRVSFRKIEKELGIERGLSMTFNQADHGKGNPKFKRGVYAYDHNCQRCVVAHELRIRGFNVEAQEKQEKGKDVIDRDGYGYTNLQWQTKDGKINKFNWFTGAGKEELIKEFDRLTSEVGRYHMYEAWKGEKRSAHSFIFDRLPDGTDRFYCPQSNQVYDWDYLWENKRKTKWAMGTYRVDDAILIPECVKARVKPSQP